MVMNLKSIMLETVGEKGNSLLNKSLKICQLRSYPL